MLDNYVRDFKALIDWIQLQEKLENTDAENRWSSVLRSFLSLIQDASFNFILYLRWTSMSVCWCLALSKWSESIALPSIQSLFEFIAFYLSY